MTTRATAQPLPEGSSIGVFLIADANYTAQNDVEYTCQPDSVWTSETSVWVGGKRAKLCAYYPFGKVAFSADTPTQTTLKTKLTRRMRIGGMLKTMWMSQSLICHLR